MHKCELLNKQVNMRGYIDCFKFTYIVLRCIKYNKYRS